MYRVQGQVEALGLAGENALPGFRVVQFGTIFDSRGATSQKCEAAPRRARIQGSSTLVSLNPRLESNKEEAGFRVRGMHPVLSGDAALPVGACGNCLRF